jgi:4-hydroxymandelate oxidase
VRLVPRLDLVNVLEYEEQAKASLNAASYSAIAGGDRSSFDRVTLRARMMVPARDLELGLTLFGQSHFAPIVVGPVADQRRFDPAGEAATVQGASAAQAAVVVTASTSTPIEALTAASKTPVWFQAFVDDADASRSVSRAVAAGCRAIVLTVGAAPSAAGTRAAPVTSKHWNIVGAVSKAAGVPVIVKGATSPALARRAVQSGAAGVVFSDYGGLLGRGTTATILDLPAVVEAVGPSTPVLADGGMRRGTDILKALALGATAVLVARPVMWGLGAYGAEGVQGVLEMLQTELARYMVMCGKTGLNGLDKAMLRVHAR